jgi:hypothetical protein
MSERISGVRIIRIGFGYDEAIKPLIPSKPPCFETALDWSEYLRAAAFDGAPVLIRRKGEETIQFNRCFNYCEDCTKSFKQAMREELRCRPNHLLQGEN